MRHRVGQPDHVSHRLPLGNPLLAHDLIATAAVLRALFASLRNLLAVAFVAAIAIMFVREAVWSLPPTMRSLALLGAASLAALSLDLALRARLRYFQLESPLAPTALEPGNRATYRLAIHLLFGVALEAAICLPDIDLAARSIACWWLMVALAQLLASLGMARGRPRAAFAWLLDLWRSRTTGAGAPIATLAGASVIFVAGRFGVTAIAPFAAPFVSLCLLLWYAPADHGVVNFERIAGYPALRSVRTQLGRAAAIAAVFAGSAAASLDLRVLFAVLATGVGVLTYKLLAVLLSRFLASRLVEFALALVLFVVLASAFAMPWVAPILLIVVLGNLLKKAERATWILE
jgi:hypothetical protein